MHINFNSATNLALKIRFMRLAMNELQEFEQRQAEKLAEGKEIPDFQAGDTVRVNVRIKEGNNERIQALRACVLHVKMLG